MILSANGNAINNNNNIILLVCEYNIIWFEQQIKNLVFFKEWYYFIYIIIYNSELII